MSEIIFRQEVRPEDAIHIREIVHSTGFFHDFEVDVAVELVEERLLDGMESGYHFLYAEKDGKTIGYTCFGQVACTKYSWDVYWIAVHNDHRTGGIGGKLLKETEKAIKTLGGKNIYLETSSMEKYTPTRAFYIKYGYTIHAQVKDFYDDGDDKIVYGKRV
jgi:ribosomal protein S18 acetylase RimI-like enzyme